jgi:hypothetical protein
MKETEKQRNAHIYKMALKIRNKGKRGNNRTGLQI